MDKFRSFYDMRVFIDENDILGETGNYYTISQEYSEGNLQILDTTVRKLQNLSTFESENGYILSILDDIFDDFPEIATWKGKGYLEIRNKYSELSQFIDYFEKLKWQYVSLYRFLDEISPIKDGYAISLKVKKTELRIEENIEIYEQFQEILKYINYIAKENVDLEVVSYENGSKLMVFLTNSDIVFSLIANLSVVASIVWVGYKKLKEKYVHKKETIDELESKKIVDTIAAEKEKKLMRKSMIKK